ncbi:MAG: response regulator transcription factor [Dehalococcoidia bacterium]
MPQQTILLVEDEETLARAVAFTLNQEGYRVLTAADGAEGLALARQARPDLLLLDIMLPQIDGLELCRILRRETTVPILMVTAKVDEVDRIVGLELGADDYLTKPFSMRELVARVRALLRRIEMDRGADTPSAAPAVLKADGLELDPASRVVTLYGKAVALRPKEFDLLAFLLRNSGIVFSRDALLERVWGYEYVGDTRTVDVHICWLREKIEDDPANPRRLITMRGVGYKLEA